MGGWVGEWVGGWVRGCVGVWVRAKLCPISFAPCPFPNLAGTLFVRAYVCACDVRVRVRAYMRVCTCAVP